MKDYLSNSLIDFYKNTERQSPGSPEMTQKALSFIPQTDNNIEILDIGCGTGAQTITLAKIIKGSITAVDLYPQFLEMLETFIQNTSLHEKIKATKGSMDDLSFPEKSFDIVWSEGAIYNIGFTNGIRNWRRFIKDNGYLVVSEISWLTSVRPQELTAYWTEKYSGIGLISEKVKALENEGYSVMASFVLPDNCWIDHYYQPALHQSRDFLKRQDNNQDAQDLILQITEEADIYNRYKEYYGYVFYIARKNH